MAEPVSTSTAKMDNKQGSVIAVCVVMMAASTVVVFLRLWACLVRKQHRFGWDDVFAILTLPFILSECSLILWWVHLGLGKHASQVPPEDLEKAPLIIFAGAFLYDASISFPKLSALFFYRRIFSKTIYTWFHYALWLVIFFASGWLISAWFSTGFQCSPPQAAYDPRVKGKCFPQWKWFLGTALASMIIDLCILLLPLPLIWNLHAPVMKKLQVVAIFICGYGVIVVSIGRLVSVARAGSGLEEDVTYSTITYVLWLQCEAPISVISVCLPTLFRFFRTISERGLKDGWSFRLGLSSFASKYLSSRSAASNDTGNTNDTAVSRKSHMSEHLRVKSHEFSRFLNFSAHSRSQSQSDERVLIEPGSNGTRNKESKLPPRSSPFSSSTSSASPKTEKDGRWPDRSSTTVPPPSTGNGDSNTAVGHELPQYPAPTLSPNSNRNPLNSDADTQMQVHVQREFEVWREPSSDRSTGS